MDLVIDKDLGGICELEHVTDEERRHRRFVRASSRAIRILESSETLCMSIEPSNFSLIQNPTCGGTR